MPHTMIILKYISRYIKSPITWISLIILCVVLWIQSAPFQLNANATQLPIDITFSVSSKTNAPPEPILTTGKSGSGCFLYLIHLPDNQAQIGYDAWGFGGPISKPFYLHPNRQTKLSAEFPSINSTALTTRPNIAILKVSINDNIVINEKVYYHGTQPEDIIWGNNTIGGTSCSKSLSGSITQNNRTLWNSSFEDRPLWERAHWFLTVKSPYLLTIAVWISIFGLIWPVLILIRDTHIREPSQLPAAGKTSQLYAYGTLAICLFAYFSTVTQGSFSILNEQGFGHFYDYQAKSILSGRLDVPPQAIEGEAFIFNGKSYGYFGLTPAILRIPFAAGNISFGQLSRSFILIYISIALFFTYQLLRLIYKEHRGNKAEPPAWASIGILLNAGLGSVYLFLGGRAYVYHEAILCGAAFATASVYFSVRYFLRHDNTSWRLALILGILSIHGRPTSGLFALLTLAIAALWPLLNNFVNCLGKSILISESPTIIKTHRKGILIAILAAMGVLSFNLVGYLKFHDFGGFPLKYNVQYTPERLARFDGKQVQLINIRHNLHQYFTGRTIEFSAHFPYLSARNISPGPYTEAMIDMMEPTVGIPWIEPGIFAIAILGSVYIFLRGPKFQAIIGTLWLAAIPFTIIMLSAVVLSQRYTADFNPLFISIASIGLAYIASDLVKRRWFIGLFAVLTFISILTASATCLKFQATAGCGNTSTDAERYQRLFSHIDNVIQVHQKK